MDADPSVTDYLERLPTEARVALDSVREVIRGIAPEAAEVISYGIPTFTIGGRAFVHVGAWKRHLSLYPVPSGDPGLDEAMAPYRSGPGTLRFPLDQPLPLGLIAQVVQRLRVQRGGAQP
jgi:uncharacterized protein YdhG (YjbR/CyaY superfamily)